MDKLSKIITLISMLYHRRSVGIKAIQDMCNISERTAYRYLNDISAANIPVLYDKTQGGYCLSHGINLDFARFGIDEMLLTIIALKLMSAKLDGHYSDITNNIIHGIISKQHFEIEEIIRAFDWNKIADLKNDDLAGLTTSIILQTAISLKKKVEIKIRDHKDEAEILIEDPSLQFNREWILSENSSDIKITVPVSNIASVIVKQ